ncbi:heavy metal translocating P-type ATPase [Agaribacterium sp. ZY112]|uniref:heavy metal translocating P-type ATPase n=1 Tax=Agaribacterium sp. ZY112 TaxID=3233574 RepID=UPI003524CF64
MSADSVSCFHCGLPADKAFSSELNGAKRHFCCPACQAVSEAIVHGGLGDYYLYRDGPDTRPEEGRERFDAYDNEVLQQSFTHELEGDWFRVQLSIGGIHCAACAWLIEKQLSQLDAVDQVRVNVSTHRCSLRWNKSKLKLSQIFEQLHRIGYKPIPANENKVAEQRRQERRSALMRIGVAGLGMMQVGMVGIALHAGALQGMDDYWQHFLRWISLIFALPVMLYSAQPFFIGAWRSLRLRHLNMDVPVALALSLAFIASVSATLNNSGEVYFDSVSMFTFFLLFGRFLEMNARHTSAAETEKLTQLLPNAVERVCDEHGKERESIPLTSVNVGDRLFVSAGEVVPCDGVLLDKLAMVDEALLSGESELQKKQKGDVLLAGAVLGEPSAMIKVTATGKETRLAGVQHLLEEALSQKPKQQQFADKVAAWFVAAVLVVCGTVYITWLQIDPEQAFWIALAVLVVTCPCALSLATPAALAAGLNKLREKGLLLVSPSALETLPKIRHLVMDKTGTLTLGEPELVEVRLLQEVLDLNVALTQQQVVDYVCALEKHSRHPLAKAFEGKQSPYLAVDAESYPGQGIEAYIEGRCYRFGRADFASQDAPGYPGEGLWQLLAENGKALAWFRFEDMPRPGLSSFLNTAQRSGLALSVLSGDRQKNVDRFVASHFTGDQDTNTAFVKRSGELTPENKLSALKELQRDSGPVLMLGDGINDVPVLGAADLSVAMGAASQLARVSADAVLLSPNLQTLTKAMSFSKKVKQVIRQNFCWALGYNLVALPAAAMGLIPPWLAAIGMSLSSLVVVLNSLRLSK